MPDFTPYMKRHLSDVLNTIQESIYTRVGDLTITAYRTPEPIPYPDRFSGEELRLNVGDAWGRLFDCAWFHFQGRIPETAAGKAVVLLLDVNGEMCVFDETGTPARGLTNASSTFDLSLGMPGKRVFPITRCAQGGEEIDLWADAGCNDLFGNLQENGTIKEANIAILDEELRELYYDFEVLLDSLQALPEDSARARQILTALTDASHLLRSNLPAEAAAEARRLLGKVLCQRGGDASLHISAIGHAHMDLGWLWPIRETKRKGARTFATALAQMELYPEYVFAASQPQLFQWMKEDYPTLYEKIRQRVRERRLEPQGALWVECDTNVTGGEAIVRQLLYGRQFFREEFGVDVRYVWLPDTFGYSAALPQIMVKAGMQYFSTQKLSWSLINTFPHHSFYWQGIDGSRILVHMLPEETYNSPALPHSLSRIEKNYRDKGISNCALLVYGIGDGGGGPGEEHLERLRRLENFAGLSPVKQDWVAAFFERWAKDAARFQTWSGELYLERHQGTLTTQGRNKRFNRRMEGALRELEWYAGLAEIQAGVAYPAQRLQEIWREVLLYQFHDILPGSSIKRVYDETTERYTLLSAEVEEMLSARLRVLAGQVDTHGMDQPAIVFNPLSWDRIAWVKVGESWLKGHFPAMGHAAVDAGQPADIPSRQMVAQPDRLENDCLVARFSPDGALISLVEKNSGREAILPGEKANRLAVYPDQGDAWDFPMDYAECEPRIMQLVSAEAWLDGPRAILKQKYRLGASSLEQEISLESGRGWLEFDTRVEWRERQAMLRTSFPVNVFAQQAACQIQFGHLFRPTHRNTTWDMARDEVAAHQWVDFSQTDFGVALLNDSKYGHKVKGNVIDLNLIRSVPYPGPRLVKDEEILPGEPHPGYTDQCDHAFRYALYPHPGNLVEGGVLRAGYEFNFPLRVVATTPHTGRAEARRSNLQVEPETVVVEAFKKAEDGQGWIVRLYEASGGNAQAHLAFAIPVAQVIETDLMEQPVGAPLEPEGNGVMFSIRPFEIKSFRIT